MAQYELMHLLLQENKDLAEQLFSSYESSV